MTNEGRGAPPSLSEPRSSKPVISAKKMAANRLNSLRSTGPKTLPGKRAVRRNAVKHGFFSKFLLVNEHENRAEYEELIVAIWQHYQPLGFAEEHWAEQIASSLWRLRRVLRFERGSIALALAEHDVAQTEATSEASSSSYAPSQDSEDAFLADDLFLPGNGNLDKILRYETLISKQLNHAFAELERLQRRRRGECVPAPISLDISS